MMEKIGTLGGKVWVWGCIDQGCEGERLINCLRLSGNLPPSLRPPATHSQKAKVWLAAEAGHQKANRSEKAKKRHRSGFTGGQPAYPSCERRN